MRRSVGPILLVSLFLISVFTAFLPQKVHAADPVLTVVDENTINVVDVFGTGTAGQPVTLKKQSNGTWTGSVGGSSVILTGFAVSGSGYTAKMTTTFNAPPLPPTVTTKDVKISDPSNAFGGKVPTGGSAGSGDTAQEDQGDGCPVEEGTEMRWIQCPAAMSMKKLTNILDGFINDYLTSGNKIYADQGGEANVENGYKKAWTTFSKLAAGLLMLVGLAMLISEALGLSIFDAYTVRKTLPRLLIAIIGIAVSWELCKFLIMFFDDLGQAMGSIIYSSLDVGYLKDGVSVTSAIFVQWVATGGIAIGAALLLGAYGILTILGTLILAMLVAAVVLILRQAIIIAAVIMAPLAIASYVLPNTRKLANFWWDAFTRMLMLYPIATGIIALTKSLGVITLNTGNAGGAGELNGLIANVTGALLFIIGYAALPFAARMAGGAMATLSGMVNDRSRGAFDRLKNARQKNTTDRLERAGRGDLYKGKYGTGRINNFTRGAAAFKNSRYKGAFLTDSKARTAAMSEHAAALGADHAESHAGKASRFNDSALQAMASGSTESEARKNLKNVFGMDQEKIDHAISEAKANGGFSVARQQYAVVQAAATGTAYDNLKQMSQVIALASRGNEGTMQSLVGGIRSTGGGGRYDLVGMGHSTLASLAEESMKSNGQTGPSDEHVQAALIESARSNNASRLLTGKAKSTSYITNALTTRLKEQEDIVNSKDPGVTIAQRQQAREEVGEITATISNMRNAAPFATEVNLSTMNTGSQTVNNSANVGGKARNAPVVAGHTALENSDVAPIVERVERSQQPLIPQQRDGKTVMVDNKDYRPDSAESMAHSRNLQTRGGGNYGSLDPRRIDEDK